MTQAVRYDVAVVGLGGMGSAVLARCALRGATVVGIEQFPLRHELGASTGKTRIIRKAYFEDAGYVPLLLRAYELWRDVERRSGASLLRVTGLLLAGTETSEVIVGARSAAETYDLDVDVLTAHEMRARYPRLRVRDDEVGVFERDAGVVFPEVAVDAHLRIAEALGARTIEQTAVTSWDVADDETVRLRLSDGSTVEAGAAVFALGPWFAEELKALGVPLVIQRNVQAWFEPDSGAWDAGRFPVFLIDRPEHSRLYGFPDMGDGVKAAFHGFGEETEPGALRREADERDIEPLARAVDAWMPGAASRLRAVKACMYSLTPDEHFVIDRHPHYGNVVVCGGFSGHGFKFASVVGEIGAQLALDRATPHDIGFLSLARFG